MITVCVCTHRRPNMLQACLKSLQQQLDAPDFQILVVDNDLEPSAQAITTRLAEHSPRQIQYLHASAHNIALARNHALAASSTPLLAFFDDDQEASPYWLKHLRDALADADAAFGPVNPIYPDATAHWLQLGAFHQKRIAHSSSNQLCGYGYTANVLLRRDRIPGLRFDLELGQTGGEDTQFFKLWADQGADFRWAEAAVAQESIAADRCSMAWLLERQHASGHTHARIALRHGQAAVALYGLAALKWSFCQIAALVQIASPVAWRRTRLRGALHAGVMAAVRGKPAPRIYA